MASKHGFVLASLLTLAGGLSACSGKKAQPPQIFFGECKVEVQSKTKDAEILIDNVVAGQGSASVSIPCGEKQIRVEKHGFVPYSEYHQVFTDKPLSVSVELEPLRLKPDFALSNDLVAQAKTGRRIRNPWTTPAGTPEEPEPVEVEAAPQAAASTGGGAGAAGASAGGASSFSENVEDWR